MPLYIIAALVMIVLDQVVKYWALTSLQAQHTIPLIENVFHLTYVENRGAAFSLLAQFDSRWIFVALAVIITIVIFIVLRIDYIQTALGRWSLVLVAAGALGNAIDRVIHGFVVDLFDFRLIHFPVFNVADIFICVGGVLFVIYFMFQHKDKVPEKKASAEQPETEPESHE
ncbi:MAG TPA: signal peptidase II [Candidatus Agathobaculum stercoravium]|nr:signal peptidase II [uncultured Agathobaculum sp.]HIV97663.1 signal peptidase II [Candidatus Agathobaculum stercoravium]